MTQLDVTTDRPSKETLKRTFTHLTESERGQIEALRRENYTMTQIAHRLNRSVSTISRELKRGTVTQIKSVNGYEKEVQVYYAETGQLTYQKNRRSCVYSLFNQISTDFWESFEVAMKEKPRVFSVDTFIPIYRQEHPKEQVPCTKTLYNYINQNWLNVRRIDLPQAVRRRRVFKSRQRRINKTHLGKSIECRSEEVNRRQSFGHWEVDLVLGKRGGDEPAILTLVERKTRYCILRKIKDKTAKTVNRSIRTVMKSMGYRHFKTLTTDNGSEFADLSQLSNRHREVYYCHPNSPQEKGGNERLNGLLREFIPKGTSLLTLSKKTLKLYQNALNQRPRKILDYRHPSEEFQKAVDSEINTPDAKEIKDMPSL